MRSTLILLLLGIGWAGCHLPPASHSSVEKAQSGTATAAPKRITPIDEAFGRVASVNADLRFVVIDFSLSPMPAVGQHFGLYRGTQKVGQVKISGPENFGIIGADIESGDAQVGDQAHPD